MFATIEHDDRQREMLRTVEDEVDPGARVDGVQARDVEDPDVEPEVDVHEQDLEHQREPEDGHGEPDEAERRRRVVERAVLA